jgi:hypothetical protein
VSFGDSSVRSGLPFVAQGKQVRPAPVPARRSQPQAGYALLFAILLSATMFLLAMVAAPSIINQGRREREQQLIWRGNQYVRGIRLYFQKNGRFPQNKDELIKGTLQVHFVRKAYADPMNSPGADWRMIYVAPSGQLTGSVRYHTLQEMATALGANTQNAGNLAALFGGPAAPLAGGNAAVGAQGAGRGAPGAAGGRGGPGAAAGAGAAAPGQTPGGAQAATGFGQPTPIPLEAVDGPVFGASMVGIASKVKKTSLKEYQGKDTYFEWEFIWNPLLAGGPGGTAPVPGAQQPGVGGLPGGITPPVGALPGPGRGGPGAGGAMPGPFLPPGSTDVARPPRF